MISVGDAVVACRDGGTDRNGLPLSRPVVGRIYRITSIYEMAYGLGCTVAGLDPAPYRGYLLYVKPGRRNLAEGWYFSKLAVADEEFTAMIRNLGNKHDADKLRSGRGTKRPTPSR